MRNHTLGLMLLLAAFIALTVRPAMSAPRRSDSVVKASTKADRPDDKGDRKVTINLSIEKDWHLYANPVPKDFPGIPTTISASAGGKPLEVKVEYPEGRLVKDPLVGDYRVYEKQTAIKVLVKQAKGAGAVELNVKVQACSDKQCLLPATLKLKVN